MLSPNRQIVVLLEEYDLAANQDIYWIYLPKWKCNLFKVMKRCLNDVDEKGLLPLVSNNNKKQILGGLEQQSWLNVNTIFNILIQSQANKMHSKINCMYIFLVLSVLY